MRADAFLVDTVTGRVWKPIQFTDLEGEPAAWKYQDRIDSLDELRMWALNFKAKSEKSQP
jgi:hypothetical protein